MAWYWIVLIVIGALFLLTFITFIGNFDMKLVAIIYSKLNEYHDRKEQDRDIAF